MQTRTPALFAFAILGVVGTAQAAPISSPLLPSIGSRADLMVPVQYRDYYDDDYDDEDRRDRRYNRNRDRDGDPFYDRRDRGRRNDDGRDRDRRGDNRRDRDRGDRNEDRRQTRRSGNELPNNGYVITDPNDPRLNNVCRLLPDTPICRSSRGRAR